MPAYPIIGGHWGDEGKGKIVDYLAQKAHIVARYSGGNNAGHTVINEHGEFHFHLVPSGMFWDHIIGVIGNGAVVDPGALLEEIDGLIALGINVSKLQISDRAHLVMPYHIALDQLEEAARGDDTLGTTGRGIGPTYVDKAARSGIRVGDLLDIETLIPRLKNVLAQKNVIITKIFGGEPFRFEDVFGQLQIHSERLRSFISPVEVTVQEALRQGKNIILEGAQGSLLDLDHGTYPYVTSSQSTVGGACIGLGLSPNVIGGTAGVYKAYTTRVGSGPMPAELEGDVGLAIREKAWEYGTTTGRPRRVGWFDAVAGRYSAQVNGFTSAILTRLDVLDDLQKVKICVSYQVNGDTINIFPSSSSLLAQCKPVYEELPGWSKPTAGLTEWEKLPREAKHYVKSIEKYLGCPIDLISTGPRRDETITLRPIIT